MFHDIEYVKKLWGHIESERPINIYINIPFCMCSCRYCLYKGKLFCSEQEKKDFVYQYLIPSLKKYHEIFAMHPIDTIYFGGGTPNAISSKSIIDICDSLGEIYTKANSRIIEMNPAFIQSEEYLEEVCNNAFTLVTFGVQSFDEESLKFQKRPYVNADMIHYLGSICHAHNTKFSIDLMCYLKTYTVKDISTFKNDVNKAQETEADFITCYPELNLISKDEDARNQFINTIKNMSFDKYYLDYEKLKKDINPRSIFRLINKQYSFEDFSTNILPYYENDFPYAFQNIIGFGDYGCGQEVVSYAPRKFFYTEKNNNNIPLYNVRYNLWK